MSEEYRKFAQSAPSVRRVTLQFMKINPAAALPLFKEVYRFDPDPDLRNMAREVLLANGITPPESSPSFMAAASLAPDRNAFSGSPINAPSSPLRDLGIGSIRADDALSQGERSLQKSLAAENDRPAAPFSFATRDDNASELHGGTGRPVQRGPQHSNVFTIGRGNLKYLTGEKNRPDSGMGSFIIGIVFLLVFGVGFNFLAASTGPKNNDSAASMGLIFAGFSLVVGAFAVRSYLSTKKFHENGTLLLGQISSASGRWVTSGSGKNRSRKYKVTVNYQVRTPDGEVVNNKVTQTRGDLASKTLPPSGTPVAVLMLPDTREMRLL